MKDLPILNLYHSEIEPDIAKKIAQSEIEEALFAIAKGVDSFYSIPYVFGHSLYLAGFDKLMKQLGDILHDDPHGHAEWTPGAAHMLILSELYNAGGHS